MKKLFSIVLVLGLLLSFTQKAEAQFANFTLSKTSTSAGTDTITGNLATYPASIAMTAVMTMTQISGTQGKIVLFGSNVGNTFTRLDSTTVSYTGSTATVDYTYNHFTNSKFDKPDFLWYRFVWYQTAGSVSAAKGKALVRTPGGGK